MDLITGPLDKYDYITFAFLLVAAIAFFYVIIAIGGLPGKLAERRNHPHAESVKIVGWIGLFTAVPWIHALIWAYHDSITVDVRSMLGRDKPDDPPPAAEPAPPARPVAAVAPSPPAPPAPTPSPKPAGPAEDA